MASYVGTPSVASSASSVVNVSVDDGGSGSGMVVTGGDALEVEGELVVPSTIATADGGDVNTALKETLKKTLMQSNGGKDMTQRAKQDRSFSLVGGTQTPINIAATATASIRASPRVSKPRQYFVLTSAGKPVFVSRRGSSKTTDDDITSAMGIMQAIISIYADDGDKIRCLNAGSTRITFLLRPPLYYVCVSSWGEPESVTRLHLEYLHLQILSVVTGSQLARIFEKRTNFDLRRLLDGTERFLHSLLTQLELDMGMITSSLNVVRIDPMVRAKVAEVMVPPKDLKAHLHILLNTLSRSSLSSVTGPDASTWLPICLPKFNPNGFLHTYVSYLVEPAVGSPEGERTARPALVAQRTKPLLVATPKQSGTQESRTAKAAEEVSSPTKEEGEDEGKEAQDRTSPVDISADIPISTSQQDPLNTDEAGSKETSKEGQEEGETKSSGPPPPAATPVPKVSLAVVTADREGFEKVRDWASKVINTLIATSLLTPVFTAAKTQDILCTTLGIPGLRHFIYKSRSHVQLVVPGWEDPYADPDEKRRLITLYQIVHDAVHARSGQPGGPLKLYFVKTEEECILGWITTPFELYVTTSPKLPKSAVVSAANAVSRWVKKHEGELVLRDAPVF
ncbi:Vacuolar fusion protein mon1 [Tulasnella sp. 424]|nr:Vacuolar fusion protein mon1 [Tulasnella sp. 424]KAG8977516.1 Vacuolar fusion protein mon1 [Tulasnella sp. 425]